ncbi:Nop53 protein [Teladorsagia circumcincta]|uniref:Ribosome biogenesis protein NOP53 n=1 Tax=Teladorsagia circumcincta TaxID=45464 RepID=A0A2G9TTD4_TELCI|nr:Nop53 protein [Teladorsagia circumcincta]
MVLSGSKGKGAASRTSRHKKKYWRKGTDISDVEKLLHQNASGSVAHKKDEELFTIDRTPNEPVRHTRRQQAALAKISRSIGQEKKSLPTPTFPTKKQPKLKHRVKRNEPQKPTQQKEGYDLWEKDFVPKVDIEFKEAAEHLLRYTKKKLPNMPSTCRFKPSLLDAVAVPDAGASYNPKAEDYQKYVERIAEDETKLISEEQRIQSASKPRFESIVTHAEKRLEETEGLVIDPRYNADDGDDIEDNNDNEVDKGEEKGEKISISHLLRKTRKQKANVAKEKKLQREHKRRKELEKAQHSVYRAKSINKALERAEKESLEKSVKRKKEKFLEKMTTRQRLGRGEFKEYEEPFLLQEELADSLRLLKPQGHVLNERMVSLQKRNMLPIGGERSKKKLKTKLKKKFVEKRSVAEVKKGTRVI